MRIGFYQFKPVHRDRDLNLERIASALSGTNAELVVLPEMCSTGYLFESREELAGVAEPVPDGPTCGRIMKLCRERNMSVVFGMAESAGERIFNSAVLVTAEGEVHTYRKSHLFVDEKDIFDPGDTGFRVFDTGSVKIGMLVCFDYIFPESGRSLALNGAQVVCHPSNLVLDYAQWMTLTRAAENRVFWVVSNRTGEETLGDRTMRFTGRSQVVGPNGKLLYRAGMDTEELPVLEIDPDDALDKKATPRNDLFEDRRTDLYRH
jgi:predicted amidohydrolase